MLHDATLQVGPASRPTAPHNPGRQGAGAKASLEASGSLLFSGGMVPLFGPSGPGGFPIRRTGTMNPIFRGP
jgi:hypothetical protein